MNVLWLASWYPNRTNTTNGDFIERHAKAIAPLLSSLTILTVIKDDAMPAGSIEIVKYQSANLVVFIAYYGRSHTGGVVGKFLSQKKYQQLQHQLFLQAAALNGMPDIVHVHVAMKAGMFASKLKKKYNIPFIVTEHWSGYFRESHPNIYDMGWLYQRLNKIVLKNATMLLPVSENLAQTITEDFVQLPYVVVPNVVDTEHFYYRPAAPGIFTFIHPSYMNYPKNPEGMLQGCVFLKQKGYRFKLNMIGNRPPDLINLAREYHLLDDYVFFENEIPYTEVARRMQQSSALLMFSRYENLPCILLEALCCGLPAVCSKVGGISEVINNANGLLVDRNDVEQLADAMQQMIDNYSYYNRPEIAANATAKFSYPVVGGKISKLYQQVVNKQ